MKRDYDTGVIEKVEYFTGTEVEKTKFYGQETLFIAKFPLSIDEIEEKLDSHSGINITHLFIGANYSLSLFDQTDYFVIEYYLASGYNITFDGTDEEVTKILKTISAYKTYEKQICGIIQVRIQNVIDLPKDSVYIKICEDIPSMQEVTNKGVWLQPLSKIIVDKKLTMWQEYKQDKII